MVAAATGLVTGGSGKEVASTRTKEPAEDAGEEGAACSPTSSTVTLKPSPLIVTLGMQVALEPLLPPRT